MKKQRVKWMSVGWILDSSLSAKLALKNRDFAREMEHCRGGFWLRYSRRLRPLFVEAK